MHFFLQRDVMKIHSTFGYYFLRGQREFFLFIKNLKKCCQTTSIFNTKPSVMSINTRKRRIEVPG